MATPLEPSAPHPPAGEPPSPCVAVCFLDYRTGRCAGCERTPEEIREWPQAPRERRWEIWEAARRRLEESRRRRP